MLRGRGVAGAVAGALDRKTFNDASSRLLGVFMAVIKEEYLSLQKTNNDHHSRWVARKDEIMKGVKVRDCVFVVEKEE